MGDTTIPGEQPLPAPPILFDARVKDIAPGVISELIGGNIFFYYDPVTGAASFAFNSREFLYLSGSPKPYSGDRTDVLTAQVADVMTRCFGKGLTDPVTGADLGGFSVAGFQLIVKAAFDTLINEREKAKGYPDGAPYPSNAAIMQANSLYDLFGSGKDGYPLGKMFGGPGVVLGQPTPTPAPAPVPSPTSSPSP